MRMSLVLLVGVAVAGAAVTTSAITSSNTFDTVDNNIAGYGELAVSGAVITNIAFTPAADPTKITKVTFTSDDMISGTSATMSLTKNGSAVPDSGSNCEIGVYDVGTTSQPITCTLTTPLAFSAFDKTGLTVVSL